MPDKIHWSASGLNFHMRHIARDRAKQAAMLALHHAPEIHYTQGPQRWSGIAGHRVAAHGQYPTEADCSAFATWCVWNGLYVPFKIGDVVNGANWEAGFTGTMATHGKRVWHDNNVIRADCVLYGSAPPYDHTAIVVGHSRDGKPVVVSHGSEAGPFLLPFDYRPDVAEIRRYI